MQGTAAAPFDLDSGSGSDDDGVTLELYIGSGLMVASSWACQTCTFLHEGLRVNFTRCDVCGAPRAAADVVHSGRSGADSGRCPPTAQPREKRKALEQCTPCKNGCGRDVASALGGRRFDTCCRSCALSSSGSNIHDHDQSCEERSTRTNAPLPPALRSSSVAIDFAALRREREERHGVATSSSGGAVENRQAGPKQRSHAIMPWRPIRTSMIPPAGNIGAITFQEMVAGCTWDFATLSNYMIDPMWLMSQWPGLADIPRIDIFHGCDALDQRQFRGFLPPHAELHNRVPKKLTFRHRRTGVVWNNTYGCHHSKFLLLGNARGIRVIITTANFLQSDFDLKTQVRSCRSTA